MEKLELYPQSEVGKTFCQFFSHRYNFIIGDNLGSDKKPNWQTISKYPIEHRNLWNRYCDENCFVGLSFAPTTHYGMIDLDKNSAYHPVNDEQEYKRLLATYEEIGLNDHLLVQSSHSGGVHVYFILPKSLPTYKLATTMKMTALKAGFKVQDGQLEIFPNQKKYGSENNKTAYKAHRLPLQVGSFLLDKDYHPYSKFIETFLLQAEQVAQAQNIEMLEIAMEAAVHTRQFASIKGSQTEASKFYQDLQEQVKEGWSDYGQTNSLLRVIGTIGRVFESLSSMDLAEYIFNKAKTLPGYEQYCQHQYNLQQRAKDWGRCIEKYYYPYDGFCSREGTFKQMIRAGNRENKVNNKRQEEAKNRIGQGINYLHNTMSVLPKKVGEVKELLLKTLQELFGVRPSDKTLTKYRHLWHPKYIEIDLSVDEENHNNQSNCSCCVISKSVVSVADTKLESHNSKANASEIELKGGDAIQEEPFKNSPTPFSILNKSHSNKNGTKPISSNDQRKNSLTPLYKKVKNWFEMGVKLVAQSYTNGLVTLNDLVFDREENEIKKIKQIKPSLRSIDVGEEVFIVSCDHSSFLFSPEKDEILQVYVIPASKLDEWNDGIAIAAKFLKEKLMDDSS